MRVGISILTHEGQSVWENGLGQNVYFLAQLLRASPAVTDVLLINCGNQSSLPAEAEPLLGGLRLVPAREATHLIDVAIEMSGGLDVEWLDYIRALGKKVVFLCCGQPYVGLIESTIFKHRGYFSRAQRCDEVWVLPKDRTFVPMLEALHRCPVFQVPYIWDPVFIARRSQQVENSGGSFGYRPLDRNEGAPRSLRVAIFEPNISVVKCFMIAALACDTAFRREAGAVERLDLLNTVQMQEHPTFDFLRRSFALQASDKVKLEGRHDFAGYMSQFADAVISHQWQNDQNFLYLDALYGGYPLIHNSPWLKAHGYYYPDFDVQAGASALLRAAHEHDALHADYVRNAHAFLSTLSPFEPSNSAAYLNRLLRLSATTRRASA